MADGRFVYEWNAENKPVRITEAGRQKLEFAYDYAARRTGKKVYKWENGAWFMTEEIKFVYDGNNLVAEYDGSVASLRSYVYGEDASGTLQGAGSTGGLLAVTSPAGTHLPVYDGNWNVVGYVNATDGKTSAEYEYGPFGKIICKSGPLADNFKIRFSTQYFDSETGSTHYLHRDLDHDLGRWRTRDPIGENDGPNIYAFVKNNPVNNWDYLGLWGAPEHKKITSEAINLALAQLKKELSYKCKKKITEVITNANVGQDAGWLPGISGPFDQMEIHYNSQGDYEMANALYDLYIAKEINQFRESLNETIKFVNADDCEGALAALGRASHPWQDFYLHSMKKSNSYTNDTSEKFQVFNRGSKENPESHSSLAPSSYPGEHPKFTEPIQRDSAEWISRYVNAVHFTKEKYKSFLEEWLQKCKCKCEDMNR